MGRRLLGVLAALLIIAVAAFAFLSRELAPEYRDRPAAERPELLLLTSLPIVFPERFALDTAQSPTFRAMQGRYRVNLVSVADAASLKGHRLLLLVQPRAQPAEHLVELDSWVRSGGRVLLLADPALQWPSDRPLGDPLRPPFAFADTGLLLHWGLRLDPPGQLGPSKLEADGLTLRTSAAGKLEATAADCTVSDDGLVSRCTVGRGRVTVIADADFIDATRFGRANLRPLFAELAALER
jgi:hypothetical protein